MSIELKIIDYNFYKQDIDHWIELKGETKYLEFVKIMEENHIEITWETLKDTYRYDKRLLVNCFKYLSFYEEFLRAQVWNISQENYKNLESKCIIKVIEEVIHLEDKIRYKDFNLQVLKESKNYINYLRNRVMHNKIVLSSVKNKKNIKELLVVFKNCLPETYKNGFVSDINKCCKELKIDERIIINMD